MKTLDQNQLDKAIYGVVLKGKGPWSHGPKTIARRKYRIKLHEFAFGKNESCNSWPCPVCKPWVEDV